MIDCGEEMVSAIDLIFSATSMLLTDCGGCIKKRVSVGSSPGLPLQPAGPYS